MSEHGVRIEDADQVRRVIIDRPESRNGLTIDTNKALIAAVREAGESDELRVVMLTGAGGHFCSGLDLRVAMRRGPMTPERLHQDLDQYFHGLIRAIRDAPMPTIAVLDGMAVGFGLDLALACDLRVASQRARFGEIFVRRGLIPDGGSTFMLPRMIGLARTLELMYTGDIIDAETAHRFGMVNHVYRDDELDERATALAQRLAKGPPISLRHIKAAVYASLGGDLESALERERMSQVECLQSRDFAEGLAAFFGKREPDFKGS